MISAVILNYFNPALTEKAVNRLFHAAEATDITAEVIVVDNSAPETADELHNRLPGSVQIIENEENRGFAAASNQGIERAGGDVILIMNNDLFINEEVLRAGTEHIIAHKETGIWAPKLVDEKGKPQRTCANFPTLTGLISEYWFKYQWGNRVALSANRADHPIKVDTVIGACMFVRKAVLQEAGLFDEDYFFTGEDVDLCYRIKNRGYQVLFDPRCKAVHLYGASQDYEWHEDPFLHHSRKLYFKKHFNKASALIAGLAIDSGIMARKLKHKVL